MSRPLWIIIFCLALILGIFLRVSNFEPFKQVGFDENVYRKYVEYLGNNGLTSWPQLMETYYEGERLTPITCLPPTRVTFLFLAALWQKTFGVAAIDSVRAISTLASVLVLAISPVFAWRIGGRRISFAVLALIAVAPTQIYLAHRALIDGFFSLMALLALWTLWETLQKPTARFWLSAYGISLALMVATKENAAFVWLALVGIILVNRFTKFGTITRPLLITTLLAPAAGLLLLTLCAGDIRTLLEVFQINVTKSARMPYAIATGDGPWFRYLTDLLLVNPAVLIFAIGGSFTIQRKQAASFYLFIFIFISYFAMTNVRYGMNLRYASIWDFPLRWLAVIPLQVWSERFSTLMRRRVFFYSVLALLCFLELANYFRIFVACEMYDPVTIHLMRALRMLQF